ncbi:MAG: hypothetical protein ABIK36_09325 [Pseudomonadota bacterium]
MGRGISEARWLAARELSEGEPPTRVRVAAVLGVDNSHVYSRSAAEGWRTIDHRNQEIRGLYREVQTIAAALSGREPPEESGDRPPPASAKADPEAMSGMSTELEAAGLNPPAGDGAVRGGPAGEPAIAVPEWDKLDPVELLANASGFVARQVGRLIANADRRGGRLDKAQVDGLAALAKMMDRWEVLAAERAKANKKKKNENLREILRKIDDKIIELAEEEARRLLRCERRRRLGRRGRGRMDLADEASAVSAVAEGSGRA